MVRTDRVAHRWVEAAGLRLHQLEWSGTGIPAVCVHGVTSCGWVWHHVARHLGATVAVDLRGHGDSGWAPTEGYTTADHADDLAAVIGAGPVDLVGSSWGALVCLAVAASRPERVRRLALIDMEPSSSMVATDVPPRARGFVDVQEAAAAWQALNPSAPAELTWLLGAAATRPAAGGGLVPAHDPFFFERWPFRDEDWWPALEQVTAPTLVVHAEHTWVRGEVCDRMASRLARAERIDIAGSAHVVPVDAPDALGSVLGKFLSS